MKVNRYEKTLSNIAAYVEILIKRYAGDLKSCKNVGLYQFFRFVADDIKYVPDPKGNELILRPGLIVKRGSGDCDDKTVLLGAYLYMKRIPFGYSLVSNSTVRNYHHIFPFIIHQGKRLDVDATYEGAEIFKSKDWWSRMDKIVIEEKRCQVS